MDQKIIDQAKQALENKKIEIEKELEGFADKDPKMKGDYDTKFPDFNAEQNIEDSAMEVTAYENTLPVEHALELKLQDINQALGKIENGTYGLCQKCQKEIDPERLSALPEAKTCAECD